MHSSISNSESEAATIKTAQRRDLYAVWSARAIVCLLLFCCALEGLTRFGFSHISRIEARIASDHRAALAVRKGAEPSILILGNSLMLEGIDYPQLVHAMSGRANVVRFPIEQTQYLDWYYGMKRLFGDGSQPDMVVLCISAEHLISSRIRGDYSAYYLFRLRDIPEIRRDVDYDLTRTSSLVLARFSLFYAGRGALRNFVLVRTDPPYAEMLQRIAAPKAHFPSDSEIERIASERLTALQRECARHGARFVFLLAPGFGPGEAPLVAAGSASQTDVLVPIHLNALGRDKFRDGFHLNASGAQIFTAKVADALTARVGGNK